MSKSKRRPADLNFIAPFPLEVCRRKLKSLQERENWQRWRYKLRVDYQKTSPDTRIFEISKRVDRRYITLVGELQRYNTASTLVTGDLKPALSPSLFLIMSILSSIGLFLVFTIITGSWTYGMIAGVMTLLLFGWSMLAYRDEQQRLLARVEQALIEPD